MVERFWCCLCHKAVSGPSAATCHGHQLHPIGVVEHVDVVVADRRHTLDPGKFGYYNMVGHSQGRDVAQQEAHTRSRIEQMRQADIRAQRENKISLKGRDNPQRVGAIPSALLFSLKRQYGQDYLQKAKELMQREGLYWGTS